MTPGNGHCRCSWNYNSDYLQPAALSVGFHQPSDFTDYLVTCDVHPQVCLLSFSHEAIDGKIRKVARVSLMV